MTDAPISENALDAAKTWLQRRRAPIGYIAVVQVAPDARCGIWTPGAASVGWLPTIDDAGAELCEAVAPVVQEIIERMPPARRLDADTWLATGGKLQLLVMPLLGQLRLRVLHEGQQHMLGAAVVPALEA